MYSSAPSRKAQSALLWFSGNAHTKYRKCVAALRHHPNSKRDKVGVFKKKTGLHLEML